MCFTFKVGRSHEYILKVTLYVLMYREIFSPMVASGNVLVEKMDVGSKVSAASVYHCICVHVMTANSVSWDLYF